VFALQHHADGPLADLGRIPFCVVHDSKFSKFGVSGKPGAVISIPDLDYYQELGFPTHILSRCTARSAANAKCNVFGEGPVGRQFLPIGAPHIYRRDYHALVMQVGLIWIGRPL
jgi:hypothetical protein